MTTVTLAVSISVAIFCTVLFVMTAAAVIVCAKKKGLYTSRRSDVLYDEPSSIILNERYQSTTDWSTPYRSRLDTSMVTNALYEPNTLKMPDAANRHMSVASERLYASIHVRQRTMFPDVHSTGDHASGAHIADEIETKMNEAYAAANDAERIGVTRTDSHYSLHSNSYTYVVLDT